MGNLENARDLGQTIYSQAETDSKIVELSPPTQLTKAKSSLLKGTFSLSNTVIEAGFGTKLYTGNGSTQSIDAGVDLATQWGDDASETYGGLVWVKSRSGAYNNNLCDTIRGAGNTIRTNTTEAELDYTAYFTSFNNNGFSVESSLNWNSSSETYASWIFQTTHRISGTTNHGKAYTCHYNPITGFTMVKYEGSGIAGHEIPHHLGRKLGFAASKGLTTTFDWIANGMDKYLYLNKTNASPTDYITSNNEMFLADGSGSATNGSGNSYILYGWANSYYDDLGELNGNYEVGIYQGTGASGNKITTRGKPAWVMVKRLDSTSEWYMYDNQRYDGTSFNFQLYPNLSASENTDGELNGSSSYGYLRFDEDGITLSQYSGINTSGGQYLYFVAYDNDNASGLSKYPKASETSNITLTNGVVAYSDGVGSNGANSSIENLGSTTIIPSNGWQL